MKKITLMRHGLSVGNERGIIQGKNNFPLSNTGRKEVANLDITNLKDIETIYCSNLSRSIETGQIISQKLNHVPIIRREELRENSAGILDGKTKDYCEKNLKKYLNIYLDRKDYNDIPGADSWKYNQSRALVFLSQYFNKEEYNDLIVTHAGFMRTLYNLCKYQDRNTPLSSYKNNCFHEITNPLDALKIKKIDIAKTAMVYKVGTYDNDYILKTKESLLSKNDYLEYDLLFYLNQKNISPEIIYMDNIDNRQVKIMDFIEGNSLEGRISNNITIDIINKVNELHHMLKEYNSEKFGTGDIIKDLIKSSANLLSDEDRKIAESLIKNEKLNNYLKSSETCLVHNDLHRSNILYKEGKTTILDYDNIKNYPIDLQLATFICSFELLENNYKNLDFYLEHWQDKVDKDIIDYLVKYRLLYGLAFFDNIIRSGKYNEEDIKIRKKYLGGLRKCAK